MTRMISHVYDHLFSPGWSGGYGAYRYGTDDGKVYNPAKRPRLATEYLSAATVAATVEILRDVPPDTSAWAREGETRTGLRRGLLSEGAGLSWQLADDTAAEIVRRAFAVLRVSARPSWELSQRYATREHQCLWCSTPLEGDGRFCSAAHARLAIEHFDYETNWGASPVGRAAYRVIRRDREEERTCALDGCARTFRPMSADSGQRYCCPSHAYQALRVVLPERECEHCGTTFQPNEAGQRFCSQAHATAALRVENEKPCECCGTMFKPKHGSDPRRDKFCSQACALEVRQIPKYQATCDWCGVPFLAKTRGAHYCCEAHAQADRRARRGWVPKTLSPGVFDHYVALQAA